MTTKPWLPLLVLLIPVACGEGDKGVDCATTASCAPSVREVNPTYTVLLVSAPTSLGALVVALDGQAQYAVTLSAAPGVSKAAVSLNATNSSWRALLAGPLVNGAFATIRADGPCNAPAPRASVVEAARSKAFSYAMIPSSQVTLSVTRVSCGP